MKIAEPFYFHGSDMLSQQKYFLHEIVFSLPWNVPDYFIIYGSSVDETEICFHGRKQKCYKYFHLHGIDLVLHFDGSLVLPRLLYLCCRKTALLPWNEGRQLPWRM